MQTILLKHNESLAVALLPKKKEDDVTTHTGAKQKTEVSKKSKTSTRKSGSNSL